MNRCIKCDQIAIYNLKTVFYCKDCFIKNIQYKFLRAVKPILQQRNKILLTSKYGKLLEKLIGEKIASCFINNFYCSDNVDNILVGISMDQYANLIMKNLFADEELLQKKYFYPFENISTYELDIAVEYYNIDIEDNVKDRLTVVTDEFCEEINKWNYSAFYNIKKLHEKISKFN